MKLWDDDSGGRWKQSVKDIEGEVLCVSQFTQLAKTTKGSKPDFHGALGGDEASILYHYFFQEVQKGYLADRVKNGKFQAMMEVALVNDGPVTLELAASPPPPPANAKST
ncbi:D-aminoacyl-tRNA deacylase like protein [Verticillium longisporum]|uniref:D-aminoacyl-tRNA deacylase n=1 Tax=Verticillium longisporum TaxID=100787 RepID=A0A8I2ZD05_VERLO|nr:D-aminoacyl-tRNA deacylase like protein [Verticillium longisporum]